VEGPKILPQQPVKEHGHGLGHGVEHEFDGANEPDAPGANFQGVPGAEGWGGGRDGRSELRKREEGTVEGETSVGIKITFLSVCYIVVSDGWGDEPRAQEGKEGRRWGMEEWREEGRERGSEAYLAG